jgi:hypothetical protein
MVVVELWITGKLFLRFLLYKVKPVYFLSFLAPPLVFAVPRVSFALFLRCLPVCHPPISHPSNPIYTVERKHTLLTRSLLNLGGIAVADKTVVGLKLLQSVVRVVDQREAGRLATTILGAETKDRDLFLAGFVELGELGAEFVLGYICDC